MQLDNISSDEELNNSLVVSNRQPLEDVDSDDDLSNNGLNRNSGETESKDNISSDDEDGLSVTSFKPQPLEDVDSEDELCNNSLGKNLGDNTASNEKIDSRLVMTPSNLQPLEDVDSEDELDNDDLKESEKNLCDEIESSHLESLSDDELVMQETISKCEQARVHSFGNESRGDASQQDGRHVDPLSETELVSETGDTDNFNDELDYDDGHA